MDFNMIKLAAVGDTATPPDQPSSNFVGTLAQLQSADICIAQSERLYTLSDNFQTQGCAPHVRQNPEMAKEYLRVPFDVVSIGSNHIMEFGPEGASDTINTFADLGIPTVGAGHNIEDARKPVIIEKDGIRFGFLGYVSVLLPQYWATADRAGATPMRIKTFYEPWEYQPGSPPRVLTVPHAEDLANMQDDIHKLKTQVDHVIVSQHWGIHFISKPLPDYMPVVAHACVDAGASVVLGTHPHVIQATEWYKDSAIFYSLGNFAFYRNTGSTNHLCPMAEYSFSDAYDVDIDPDIKLIARRHGHRGTIAEIDFEKDRITKITCTPTVFDGTTATSCDVNSEDYLYAIKYHNWVNDKSNYLPILGRGDPNKFVLYKE